MKRSVYILGAGISGLSALRHLDKKIFSVTVFEKEGYSGGLCYTVKKDGYYFDKGIHVSFTKNKQVKKFLTKSSGEKNILEGLANPYNFFDGNYYGHPIYCNLYGMKKKSVSKYLYSFLENYYLNSKKKPKNFDEWIEFNFGKEIGSFLRKYNRKIWNLDLKKMNVDWVGDRIYKPSVKEVIDGAIGFNECSNFYYYNKFRYPKRGGFISFFSKLVQQENINVNSECTSIDLSKQKFIINNDRSYNFKYIISTIPLPELVRITKNVPLYVKQASKRLFCNKIMFLNFKLNNVNKIVENNKPKWIYFYDDNIPFARGYFPHLLSDECTPKRKYAFQAEQYSLKGKSFKLSREEFLDKSIDSLIRTGIISNKSDIDGYFFNQIDYAYVIYNHKRINAVKTIRDFFMKNGIYTCGRFGEWANLWSDQALLSGKKTADYLNDNF